MTELIRRFPDPVSSSSGATFSAAVIGHDTGDVWEAWLEFAPRDAAGDALITGIETHQHERLALERWASGLTPIYLEGALVRALARQPETGSSALLAALEEIVDALDRRLPHVERASEAAIARDARRLRAGAMARIESLRAGGLSRSSSSHAVVASERRQLP